MATRVWLGVLLSAMLLFSWVKLQAAQSCTTPQVELFTARLNASRHAVIQRILSGVQLIFTTQNQPAPQLQPNLQSIYGAFLQLYSLSAQEESFYNFVKAMSDISVSYFRTCWGPDNEGVSAMNEYVAALFSQTTALVNSNQSSTLPLIRENIGRFFCIADNYTSQLINIQIVGFFANINLVLLQPVIGLGPLVTKVNSPAVIGYTEQLPDNELAPTIMLPPSCELI